MTKKPEEPTAADLNRLATEALYGLHLNPSTLIADLLESAAPIDLEVRCLLAAALRGRNPLGVTVDVKGHEKTTVRFDSIRRRRRDYCIGKIVEVLSKEVGVTKSFSEAEMRFIPRRDSSFWRKNYYYAHSCDKWVHSARSEGGIYATLNDEMMRDIWHSTAVSSGNRKIVPPTSAAYGQEQAWRLREIESALKQDGHSSENFEAALGEVLLMIAYLHPEIP